MNANLIEVLERIEKDKDIPMATLIEAMEAALVSAYKKCYGAAGQVRVSVDLEHSKYSVFAQRVVVEQVKSQYLEVSIEQGRAIRPDAIMGDIVEVEVTPESFGRIAAQTAKQVVVQRIREAEREVIFNEFSGRTGEILNAEVQRKEHRNVYVNLGKVEALMPPSEQVPAESYRFGQRIKVYVLDVRKTTKTPQVIVSRSHPNLLKRLFELEVPEIHDGVVEIKAVAREAGARSKIAVASKDTNVDPVGACVGHRGARVQAVVDELNGEKVDIVRWQEEPMQYLAEALSPAKIARVILKSDSGSATVVTPEDQLSLAIGRAGQNVRLAARLTGWRIDIRTEAQLAEEQEKQQQAELQGKETAQTEPLEPAVLPSAAAEGKTNASVAAGAEEPTETD